MSTEQEMKDELRREFERGCQLWNAADYNELGKRFDVDVVMKKLDDPGSMIGIGNTLVYLNENQKAKHPHFTPTAIEKIFIWGSGTVGQVSGTANYQDKEAEPKITAVRFTFTYTRSSEKEPWLLINAFQARAE
jgi:hypothetical protein